MLSVFVPLMVVVHSHVQLLELLKQIIHHAFLLCKFALEVSHFLCALSLRFPAFEIGTMKLI
jgi:hypothetical protein